MAHNRHFDVPTGFPRNEVGQTLSRCLTDKGFCVLAADQWVQGDRVGQALKGVQEWSANDKIFKRPSSTIAPALLGDYGSAQTARLDSNVVPAPLKEVEGIAGKVLQELQGGGQSSMLASPCIVHASGDLTGRDPELSEAEVDEWLRIVKTQKFMVLVFLGPGNGTLELLPFLDEDADALDIPTSPGTVVVLRADILSHTHRSVYTTYAMTSFFCSISSRWHQETPVDQLTPAGVALQEMHLARVEKVKENATDDACATTPKGISRSMQREMNHIFMKGESYSIHGAAGKFSFSHDPEKTFSSDCAGLDALVEVPLERWDVNETYDPDPDCYKKGKSWTRHMSVVDGLDLFDNKFFLISNYEANIIDCLSKQVLELGYETMHRSGLTKKMIMESDTGYLLGATFAEHNASEAYVSDLATQANRISFCLGMKGFNVNVDADHASALTCLSIGTHELGKGCNQVLLAACHFNFIHHFWPAHMHGGIMSNKGRVMAFDGKADGSVRGDGIGNIFVRKPETVDGPRPREKNDPKEYAPTMGAILASKVANQGATAGFQSPHGPSLAHIMTSVLDNSKMSPLDVDLVECDAKGRLMDDAVEVAVHVKMLRPTGEDGDEPLNLQSIKTSTGNSWYCTGMQAVIRCLFVAKHAHSASINHLKTINPFYEDESAERPLLLATHLLENREKNTIMGIMSTGWGGTNAYTQMWGSAEHEKVQKHQRNRNIELSFWPGGSKAKAGSDTFETYTIVGSWSGWSQNEMMHHDGNGNYEYTVILGDNCWEQFQIMVDGNSSKVLHPGQYKAPNSTPVCGPEIAGIESTWMIDGRAWYESGDGEITEEGEDNSEPGQGMKLMESADTGCPGTRFRVTLRTAGKWRYLSWVKLDKDSWDPCGPETLTTPPLIRGTYVVSMNFGETFTDMEEVRPGVFKAMVTQWSLQGTFQILRNGDWGQAFYPEKNNSTKGEGDVVLGPDEQGYKMGWLLSGDAGQEYEVTFERRTSSTPGFDDERKVSWRKL